MLKTDLEIKSSRQMHGENILSKPKRDSLIKQYLEKFNDPIIRILLVMVVITALLGHFVEGLGIAIAVLLATGIGFLNEWKSQKNFDILNSSSDNVLYKVFRFNNNIVSIAKKDLLVNDEIELSAGEEIPADCIVLECDNLSVDESAFTGESKPIEKLNYDDNVKRHYKSNFLLRGSKVLTGIVRCKVEFVGDHTVYGSISHDAQIDNGIETPLNKQLGELADKIGVYGTLVAFITFFALSIKHMMGIDSNKELLVCTASFMTIIIASAPIIFPSILKLFNAKEEYINRYSSKKSWIIHLIAAVCYFVIAFYSINFSQIPDYKVYINDIVNYFMIAVTIIVVAVPEGLPMATVLSLAYSVKKMFKDNNLVRKLHACETTGACTVILSDKTGTLTQNKMSLKYTTSAAGITVGNISDSCAIQSLYNSTVDVDTEGNIIGNPTEGAMLLHVIKNLSLDYKDHRNKVNIIERKLFNSVDKYMSTVIELDGVKTTLYKGAPEVVLGMCNIIRKTKNEDPNYIVEKNEVMDDIELAQNSGQRVIAFAISRDTEVVEYDGFCVIEDPIRVEVPEAISKAINAGIKPVIVTGDNHLTAINIGMQIGLIDKNDDLSEVSITGEQLLCMSDEELNRRLKTIKVVSRAKPEDKRKLVEAYQKAGEIVAVTGDGRLCPVLQ